MVRLRLQLLTEIFGDIVFKETLSENTKKGLTAFSIEYILTIKLIIGEENRRHIKSLNAFIQGDFNVSFLCSLYLIKKGK